VEARKKAILAVKATMEASGLKDWKRYFDKDELVAQRSPAAPHARPPPPTPPAG
jgi:hypothetical protein